ncbi:putative zinc metallopeptidase [Rhizodiscina lignyota]|uniref:Zinc metallopeptidase n=1 Tax=Rhizodiscina lignyota TaxID=1504668 RepID=A0A9P4IEW3_9PEZI|nr:putative zinc metallopeptidase [Rhizodiscina lignyota]
MRQPSAEFLGDIIRRYRPALTRYEEIYRKIHQNPELSLEEHETASLVERHLKELSFTDVKSRIGGTGVVGILENGRGPVVLLRADMDALPMEERTGLPYSSHKTAKGEDGKVSPVFHGCGHDMHTSCLLACADLLSAAKSTWHGTVVCLFQPAEENFRGARAMVEDGLFQKIPKPSVLLGQHVVKRKTGTIAVKSGNILTACDRFQVRIHGRGGHGSNPANCKDPIVAGAHIIGQLQTVVSREVNPADFAVLTCASFTAGSPGVSVIPDYADLTVDMRSYTPDVRERITTAAKRIVEVGCEAFGMPKKPEYLDDRSTPSTVNDVATVQAVQGTFSSYFSGMLSDTDPGTASEDFAVLAEPFSTPYAFWNFGGIGKERWEEAERKGKLDEIPANHSSGFYPDIEPTLQTGTDAMALAALTFLKVKDSNL